MVAIDPVTPDALPTVRRLHNRFTAQAISRETMAGWFEAVPGLFLLAADEGEPIGVATGKVRGPAVAELAGLGVVPTRRREGIGSRLLERFEDNARAAGFRTISIGSAGGYVDDFYASHGYGAHRLMVRFPAAGDHPEPEVLGYEVREQRIEGDTRKYYLAADAVDQDVLTAVRADLDEDAIYILRKDLG